MPEADISQRWRRVMIRPLLFLPRSTMAKITRDQAVSALVAVVREALEHGEEAHVPGLGSFRVEYRPSAAEELATGEVVMRPPRNEIIFSPHDEP